MRKLLNYLYVLLFITLLCIIGIQNTDVDDYNALKNYIKKFNFNSLINEEIEPELSINSSDDKTTHMVFPTILWNIKTEQGRGKASGFLTKHNDAPHIITTRHSIVNHENVVEELKKGAQLSTLIDNTHYSVTVMIGAVKKEFPVKIIYVDLKHDFLIARLVESYYMLPIGQRDIKVDFPLYYAKIASLTSQAEVGLFKEVTVVGYPITHVFPYIVTGILSGTYKDGTLGVTAPVVPGNSGGPVYDSETYEVIGIVLSVMQIQYGPFGVQYITHMARILPIHYVHLALLKI